VVAAAAVIYKEIGMLICCLGYIFYGLIRHLKNNPKLKAENDDVEL
jgi:CDP-diacylglycerol--serine O-phosphatidyltransferase